jgi:competence protein ComEC
MSRLRLACLRAVERYFPPPGGGPGISAEGAVFEALLLGERGRMDPGANLSLQSTGLYHLIAISGAHIGIISVILFGLFRAVRLPRRSAYALLLAVLVFYAFLVEGRASVARAVVMAAAFILAKLIWKDAHLLNAIGLSALVILVASPFQVLDMGFRLTYAATLAIILILPRLGSFLPRVPFKVGDMLGLTVAAQAGVTPMIAAAFNRVTFSGLALNLIGIPLVGVIMAAGYLFFPVAFAAPFLAKPAAVGLAFLMRAFLWSTHLLDGVPFLSYRIPTPSGIVVLGYYVFLLLLLLPARFRTSRRIAAVGFAVCFVVLVTYPFSPSAKEMTVTFLDVGQGDAILVEFPGRARMLVDAGGLPTGNFDVGESVVSPYLWRKGFKRLDLLAVSHDHPDHLYGLEAVARNFRIGEFWEPGSPAPDGPRTRLETVLAGVPRRAVGRRTTREIGGVRVEVLSPDGMPASYGTADNDRSLVLRLSFGETSVLLPGDIGLAAEEEIVATGADLRSGVLKAPHHGSDTSSSEAFLRAVRPETVVVSVGRGNRYGLPRAEVLDRYARSGARVYRTDLHGAVEVKSDGRRFSIRTSADPGPGRH